MEYGFEELRAAIDYAIDDEYGLDTGRSLEMLKRIVDDLYHHLPLGQILVRISNSEYCDELYLHVAKKKFRGKEASIVLLGLAHKDSFGQGYGEQGLIDALWRLVIYEHIVRNEFRRAWDMIKYAFKGFDSPSCETGSLPQRGRLFAQPEVIEESITLLFDAMLKNGAVLPLQKKSLKVPKEWLDYVYVPPVGGWTWAAAITNALLGNGTHHAPSHLFTTGLKVMSIVQCLNAKRAKKQSRKNRVKP